MMHGQKNIKFGHHQVGMQCQRNYIHTINIVSVWVQKKGEGTRSRLQNEGRVCRPVMDIHVLTVSA